ncbi:uncharacterized skeletal organic matrix protein 5-like [Actinia tenebrosa]|uniref:Uncharacterized skeletal organic matrix protein 5-like n=1 Tax=Actinia tenebrosa TaxID=6105 RepID=A0A6P8HMY6_ACTTE|nr:uncharacterized skeletal organic matrix protein 5-like [Actinia tenebrosa]
MHLVFCFLSVFFIVGFTDANIRVKSFKYKDDHKADGREILQKVVVSSVAKCAYQCTANKDCEDANFNRVSKFCQLLRKKPESVMLSLVEQTGYIYLGDNDEIKKYDERIKMIKERSSCKTIYDSGRSNGNKAYNLTFGTSTNWSMTYCMMDPIPVCGSGGWTLVMKIDGTKFI